MATRRQPLTKDNILRKVNRKRNPVTSVAQLAREFGYTTGYERQDPGLLWGDYGHAAPKSFRTKVKTLVGERTYNKIRQNGSVNHIYR